MEAGLADDLDRESGDLQLCPGPIGGEDRYARLCGKCHAGPITESAAALPSRFREARGGEGCLAILRVQIQTQFLNHLLGGR